MDFLKYSVWPVVRVRAMNWWWIFKYRGRRNIPPQLIFEQMAKSMERMNENLMDALRTLPPDATDKEKEELLDLLHEAGVLEEAAKEAQARRKPGVS